MRRGVTLLELVVVLAVVGVTAAIALPPTLRLRDRWLVRRARDDVAQLLAAARWRAQVHGTPVTISFEVAMATVVARANGPWQLARNVGEAYGTTLGANRTSLVLRGDGMAAGAANLTAVFSRGTAAETLRISRLGRVR